MPEAYAEGPLNGTLNIETLAKVPPPINRTPLLPSAVSCHSCGVQLVVGLGFAGRHWKFMPQVALALHTRRDGDRRCLFGNVDKIAWQSCMRFSWPFRPYDVP